MLSAQKVYLNCTAYGPWACKTVKAASALHLEEFELSIITEYVPTYHVAYIPFLFIMHRTSMNPIDKERHLPSYSLVCRAIVLFLTVASGNSFAPLARHHGQVVSVELVGRSDWIGDVVSNSAGKIKGCKIQQVGESLTEWIIQVDG
jgi:hypothetical protein